MNIKFTHIAFTPLLKVAALLMVLFAGAGTVTQAQKKSPAMVKVDQIATFPGGANALYSYLAKNIHYPAAAREKNIQGKVFLGFIVEEDGSLSDIRVKRGVGGGLDQEAVRVMAKSPKWNPAKVGKHTVRSQYAIPISFQLDNTAATTPATKPTEKSTGDDNKHFDESATFPGGVKQLYAYLAKTVRYPSAAREKNVQGRVFVSFVVEDDGTLNDVQVRHGIGSGCDEEALKAMQNSPKWVPAKIGGENVKQEMTIPINFSLAKG